MLDEDKRRTKAAKLIAVVRHALGVPDLSGLTALDVGCSAGFIADELALAGARTTGIDIDEPADLVAGQLFAWADRTAAVVGARRGLDVQQIDSGAFADDDRQHRWLGHAGFEHVRTTLLTAADLVAARKDRRAAVRRQLGRVRGHEREADGAHLVEGALAPADLDRRV